MDILVFNQDWFRTEFEAAGHRVVTCGSRNHLDVVLPHPMLSLEYVLGQCPEDFAPDRIVIFDESAPLLVVGIEESGIPAVFFSVDVQHHYKVHRQLARNFSRTLVAQKDYLHLFSEVDAQAEWFPLWSSRTYEPSDKKDRDVVFVGTMDAALNPDRVRFFEELKTLAPVTCMQGAFWEIFPHSHIVMNQTVKGDLNFRVFEAMMSGSLLLTEETPNGLLDLFIPDEHFVTYRKNDARDAANKIHDLLSNTDRCRKIGLAGRNEILSRHTLTHRAASMLDILETLQPPDQAINYYAMLPNYTWLYRSVKPLDSAVALRTISYCISLLKKAMATLGALSEETGMEAVFACVEYDAVTRGNEGAELVKLLSEMYSDANLFAYAHIWNLLNRGDRAEADRLMRSLFSDNIEKHYHDINGLMSGIIGVHL